MKKTAFLLLLFFAFSFSASPILIIDNQDYDSQDFYNLYPKNQWSRADSVQKEEMFSDFIRRNLYVLEAQRLGFARDPDLAIKIKNQLGQLLVNESYEKLVAEPLISQETIDNARRFLKEDLLLNHILIGYSSSYLPSPPKRTIDEALLLSQKIIDKFNLGESFGVLAQQYSDDPSVEKNSGNLGWVSWGQTVPDFQLAAFNLPVDSLSVPVLTDFGYHLILVENRKKSDYFFMDDEAFENAIINLSKRSVREDLRGAALKYDSLQIEAFGVVFNTSAIKKIVSAYAFNSRGAGAVGGEGAVNPLGSILDAGVVCVYGGGGLGVRWFANKMKHISSSRYPDFSTVENVTSVFRTIVLQDIARQRALSLGIDSAYSYSVRKESLVSSLLYEEYLQFIVKGVSSPDSIDVVKYYDNYKNIKYKNPDSVLVRELRVDRADLADSLLVLLNSGESFPSLEKRYGGGRGQAFSKQQNGKLYDAAGALQLGEISPVLQGGKYFSIIMLVKRVPGDSLPLNAVFSKIEATILKDRRKTAGTDDVNRLMKKYKINKYFERLK